jgi:hypothetical protein
MAVATAVEIAVLLFIAVAMDIIAYSCSWSMLMFLICALVVCVFCVEAFGYSMITRLPRCSMISSDSKSELL